MRRVAIVKFKVEQVKSPFRPEFVLVEKKLHIEAHRGIFSRQGNLIRPR